MSDKSWHLKRRTFLQGVGASLALPYLECMGQDIASSDDAIKRCCYIYSANGVSLPPENDPELAEWRWFPTKTGRDFQFGKVLESLEPLRDKVTVISGIDNPTGGAAHLCSDVWLTCGDVAGNNYNNTVSPDQIAARKFRDKTRQPFLAFSCDGGVGVKSRISTISFDHRGNPIPTENKPRLIFDRLFAANSESNSQQRKKLQSQAKMIDRILANAKDLNRRLGKRDQQKLDEYLTSIREIEDRVDRYERWLDIPLKKVDTSHIQLDLDPAAAPGEYYRTMFDLFALAFETDLTRVTTFMMSREDGFGIADTFPTLLYKTLAHHALSHGVSKGEKGGGGWLNWSRYDKFIADQVAHFLKRLDEIEDPNGKVLDNTVVLFGSGCSTTHNVKNIPLLLAGGKNLGLAHGRHLNYSQDKPKYSNLHLSLLHAMGIEQESFADSTGTIAELFST
jgi:hypothetical protein